MGADIETGRNSVAEPISTAPVYDFNPA